MSDPGQTIKATEPFAEINLATDPALQLPRIFVYFLQNIFRDAPEGSGMRWSPDEENSEVLITYQKPSLDSIQKKPHITCVLGTGAWSGLSLDQLQSAKMFSTGQRKHTDLISMTMAYHCQSRNDIHASRLAWNASIMTNTFRRMLIKGGKLHNVGVNHQVGAVSGPTAYTGPLSDIKSVSSVVTLPFYWQPQWIITEPAEVWRQMSVTFNVKRPEARYSAGQEALIRQASIRGKPVRPVYAPEDPILVQVARDDKFVGEE